MGQSAFSGIYAEGIEKVKKEVGELEKRRQKLYKDLSLPDEVKRLSLEIAALTGKRDGLKDTIVELVAKKKRDLTEEARGKIKKVYKELDGAVEERNKVKEEAKKLSDKVSSYEGLVDMRRKDLEELEDDIKGLKIAFEEKQLRERQDIEAKWGEVVKAVAETEKNKIKLTDIKVAKAEVNKLNKQLEADTAKSLDDIGKEVITLNALRKQAYDDKNKTDDYARETNKVLEKEKTECHKKRVEIEGQSSELIANLKAAKAMEKVLLKGQEDLKTNWDIFKEAQQNIHRTNLKLKDREAKIKKKETELGLKYNG